uniref:Poly(A) RNA polymerase mitochondrial-like central palm domain-containing protein n=1 Tax=Piliocolobus tephrosceles TaxID=591936 RepID=A0A8C9LH73_9PRIM
MKDHKTNNSKSKKFYTKFRSHKSYATDSTAHIANHNRKKMIKNTSDYGEFHLEEKYNKHKHDSFTKCYRDKKTFGNQIKTLKSADIHNKNIKRNPKKELNKINRIIIPCKKKQVKITDHLYNHIHVLLDIYSDKNKIIYNNILETLKEENKLNKHFYNNWSVNKSHSEILGIIIEYIKKQNINNSFTRLFQNIGKEVIYLIHLMKPHKNEILIKKKIVNTLENFFKLIYNEYYIIIFGSCNNHLDIYNSDIDICLFNNIISDKHNVMNLYTKMHNSKLFKNVTIEKILFAKVPIVKCHFRAYNISVDISFNQKTSISTTVATQKLIKNNSLIKYILIFIKMFLAQNNVNEAWDGGLSSFNILLIFNTFMKSNTFIFYQKNPFLYIGEVIYKFIVHISLFKDQPSLPYFLKIFKENCKTYNHFVTIVEHKKKKHKQSIPIPIGDDTSSDDISNDNDGNICDNDRFSNVLYENDLNSLQTLYTEVFLTLPVSEILGNDLFKTDQIKIPI